MAVNIITRVRLLFVGALLVLSFVGVAQTQLRCLEVKGKGFVQARSDVSCVENATERPCAIFAVEIGKEVSFSIKPGAQYYLEKIEIEDTSGTIKEVAREKIYAERNDTLYYQCNDTVNVKYRFIFKEVQPWSGLMYPPYGGSYRGYYLIYTPEEFIYVCTDKTIFWTTISLQNDIDFDKKALSALNDMTLPKRSLEIIGNNKIVKNCFYSGGMYAYYRTFLYYARKIINLHVLGGNISPFYFPTDAANRSVEGCTSGANLVNNPGNFAWASNCRYLQAKNCINFGDKLGNIPFFLLGLPNIQENLINCGVSLGSGGVGIKCGPACFWFRRNQEIHEESTLRYLLNFGRDEYFSNFDTSTEKSFFINNADLGSRESAENGVITQNYFNISNHKLVDSAFMRNLMGDSAEKDFIFEDGFYPRLRHIDERPGRLAASPILFAYGENLDSVRNPFYVDTNYGVRWISLSEDLVEIVGDSGYVRRPVSKDVTVRVEAWKGEFSKHVDLKIRARSFVDKEIGYDTVCSGDSVWMVTSYARKEGWNYDVIWGEGKDTSPDTVYRLHLHHKRVYRDTLHFEVARDSLPFIYNDDTIKRFGLTELHRYLTVEGCDSIIYVQLDTLDNRRKIHHWDTLCLCSGDTSVRYWRGFPIMGSGEVYDEVIDPYKGGIDTFYHLRADIYPTYHDTLYFLAERDSLPYILGKDTIRQFGWTALKALTVHGCDSITYVRLDTLYIHREQHFYDTLHTCEGGALSWRGREIARTGEYADTVFDPYKGGTDSIYHLRADIYPTYREVVHRAAVERDSMPYIYGKDTIRQFGLTELHRYQSVHGCDSITYVQLEPIDRARHFYDTLQSCGPAKFTWRGVIMVVYRTSDYIDSLSDPDKNGAKSYYHLHVAISSPYYITYTDSCYIEELPYEVAGRPIPSYGTHTVNLVSEPGCDSVCKYVLSRRWHWYRVQVRVRGEGFVNVTDTVLREDASMWLAFSASSCYRMNSLTVDGKAVPLQNRYEIRELHGDCVVEVAFVSLASAETQVGMQVCVDSLPVRYHGVDYGEGEHEIVLRNAVGCDSVIRLTVAGLENTARIAVIDTIAPPCSASEIAFSYHIEAGTPKWLRLMYDAVAKSAGFRDTVLAVGSTGLQTVRMTLPASVRPDRYGLRLWQADGTGCYVAEDALNFEIPYPSDIIVQKWNDVLAVLSSEYNGGYEFSGYQWYKNGEPMEGETRSYLYVKPYLRTSDTYAVLLERASDGLQLQSCGVKRKSYPKDFSLELIPNPTASGEAVQVSVNGKPEAEGTIEVFDGTGKPIYQRTFRRSHTLRLSVQPGNYVVRVRDAKNSWTATGKLVVK